jgi:replicative DNA helicase
MGKSALIGCIADAVASAGHPVGGFSLEMSKNQWIDRRVAGRARINSNKFRSGYFQDQDWEKINMAMDKISGLPIHIDDTGGLHYSEIRSRARKMVKKFGCKMFFIDHLQLTRGDNPNNENMEIKSITKAMKEMAKELNVPVVLLSQLNRKLEDRGNKRPVMSDLRGSGAIEQDADTIMFLYRRAVYNDWDGFEFQGTTFEKEPQYTPSNEMQMVFDSDAELSIAKQRNGPTGGMKLLWQDKFTNFYDRHPGG